MVGSIGFAGLTSQAALLTATFFAGFLVLGIQSGINVVGAMIYPTSLRANGSGWQLGNWRIGSIVGPLLGALFVGLPVQDLYMWSALPFAVGAIVSLSSISLTRRALRRTRTARGHNRARCDRVERQGPPGNPVPAFFRNMRRSNRRSAGCIRTARSNARPESPARRTAGSSA